MISKDRLSWIFGNFLWNYSFQWQDDVMKVQTEVRRKFLVVIMVSFVVLFVIVYLFLFRNFNYFFFVFQTVEEKKRGTKVT